MRPVEKKQYFSPSIKRISLISEQAALQICRVGGAFFGWGASTMPTWCSGSIGTGARTASNFCATTIKGQSVASVAGTPQENQNQPS